MKNNATRTIFSYWDQLRGERAAPERGEIEPGAIRHALADTFILEVGPGYGASIRLAGTRLCALFGGELRGRPFDDLWAPVARAEIDRCIEAVIDDTAGVVAGVSGQAEGERTLELEMILLPLRHRGKPHTRILGALSPAGLPAWIGLRHIEALTLAGLRMIGPAPAARAEAALPWSAPRVAIGDPRRRFVVHEGGRA